MWATINLFCLFIDVYGVTYAEIPFIVQDFIVQDFTTSQVREKWSNTQ